MPIALCVPQLPSRCCLEWETGEILLRCSKDCHAFSLYVVPHHTRFTTRVAPGTRLRRMTNNLLAFPITVPTGVGTQVTHYDVRSLVPPIQIGRALDTFCIDKSSFASCQLVQQDLGLLKVGGVKTLSEPAIDRRQQLIGLVALALLLPQASQA